MSASVKNNTEQVEFWNGDAGQRWATQQAKLDLMLAPISLEAMRYAAVKPGEYVLDVGCGCGDTSLELAKRVGASGRVTGIDISEPMLTQAKKRAAETKLQISFNQADASEQRFTPEYDLIFSRFGVMFFADADAAFANLRKALKPQGRIAFVCWRSPQENDWVRVPVGAAKPHVPQQPQLGPEDPGPFSLADIGRLRRVLANGGFDVITVRPFDTMMNVGVDLDDAVAYMQEFGPVSRLLRDAPPQQREVGIAAMREALKPYAQTSPVELAAAVWLVTAKNG